MKKKLITRIIAIILAGLMVLGTVITVLLDYIFNHWS